jgi:integrase
MPDYLIKQRQGWYAVLEIPKALRPKFGKTRFKQTLHTDSLSRAKARVLPVIADWKRLIELARHGHPDFAGELLQWREYQRTYRTQGLTEEEIEEIAFDAAVNLHPDRNRGTALFEVTTGKRIFLPEHIDRYLAAQDVEPKTIDMRRRDLMLLADRFQFADAITKQEVVVWVEETLIRQDGLSSATCRRIISTARGYWAYLERHHKLTLPFPFQGVVPATRKTKEAVRDRRKGFAPSDYLKLLAATEGRDEPLADLIRLGAYTGCRIEEICSLKLDQVRADRLTIEDAKTEAGWRIIPIHSHITQMVARLKDTSHDGYLLSGLTFNKYGDRSNAIGKRFGRLKAACGYGPDYVFHSFRKGVATQLEAAEVPENHVARLLGHDLKTMSYGVYSGGVPYEVLQRAVECLDWRQK